MTPEQIEELAQDLYDTESNVYTYCQSKFGVDVGEEVFDILRKDHRLFRCEECSVWVYDNEEDPDMPGCCTRCA